MQLALDPLMHCDRPLPEAVRLVADLGWENLELCSRDDFFPEYWPPRADKTRIREFKQALHETGMSLVSLLLTYRWASPDEEERQAAVRYWKRALPIVKEIECQTVNTIFDRGPSPQSTAFAGPEAHAEASEAAFWKSMEELLPIFEAEQLPLHIEAHPDDFVEENNLAVDMIRSVNSPWVKYLYCAPHTFHLGEDVAAMLRYAAPVLAHVHVADSFNHKRGWRYILNPAGTPARIHQHLDIGAGEVDWEAFFGTLAEIDFDGIMTSQVFAWDGERALQSSRFMLGKMQEYVDKYWKQS
jgi:myo-inositol catabolism protein IolH